MGPNAKELRLHRMRFEPIGELTTAGSRHAITNDLRAQRAKYNRGNAQWHHPHKHVSRVAQLVVNPSGMAPQIVEVRFLCNVPSGAVDGARRRPKLLHLNREFKGHTRVAIVSGARGCRAHFARRKAEPRSHLVSSKVMALAAEIQ